ncbi:hypothetical protein P9112_008157 [Eukaryota sp. TZLM1-RC]
MKEHIPPPHTHYLIQMNSSDHESGWDEADPSPDTESVNLFLKSFVKHGRSFTKIAEELSLNLGEVKNLYRYVWFTIIRTCASRIDLRPLHRSSTDIITNYYRGLKEGKVGDSLVEHILSPLREAPRPSSPRRRTNQTHLPASCFPVMSATETSKNARYLSWRFISEHLPSSCLLLLTTSIHYRSAPIDSSLVLNLRPVSTSIAQTMIKQGLSPRSDVTVPPTRTIRDILVSLTQMWRSAIPNNADLYFKCPVVSIEFDSRSSGTIGCLFRSLGMPRNNFKLYYGFGVRQEPKLLVSSVEEESVVKVPKSRSSQSIVPVIKARRSDSPPRTPQQGRSGGRVVPSMNSGRDLFSPTNPANVLRPTETPKSPPAPMISLKGQLSINQFFQPIKNNELSVEDDSIFLGDEEFDDLDYGYGSPNLYSPACSISLLSPPRPEARSESTLGNKEDRKRLSSSLFP